MLVVLDLPSHSLIFFDLRKGAFSRLFRIAKCSSLLSFSGKRRRLKNISETHTEKVTEVTMRFSKILGKRLQVGNPAVRTSFIFPL